MDPASLTMGAVSLVSIFSTVLDIMDYVETYRDSGSDAHYLALEYQTEKLRLEDWGRAVGLERRGGGGGNAGSGGGGLAAKHHVAFDDPRKLEAVNQVLLFIEGLCSVEGPVTAHKRRLTRKLTGSEAANVGSQESAAMRATVVDSKRKKLRWTFRDKGKAEKQVAQLKTLVQSLHDLVPVESAARAEGGGGGGMNFRAEGAGGSASGSGWDMTSLGEMLMEMKQELKFDGQVGSMGPGSAWDLSRFGQMLKEMQREFKATNRKELIEWLKVDSEPTELYESLCRSRVDTTCDWVLEKPFFLGWLATTAETKENFQPQVLWINGPAGFGKSTLCSRIIQHLLLGKEKTSVAYHFFSGKFGQREGPFSALRAWLGQLVSRDDALDVVQEAWVTDQKPSATLSSVIPIFQATVKALDHCILVIDGLDECPITAPDGSGTLEDFFILVKDAMTDTSCRLLITSRDEPRIESAMQDALDVYTYHIGLEDVQRDTEVFATNVVEKKLSKKSSEIQHEVSAKMSSLCGGQFLWLKLQAEQLRSGKNRHRLLTDLENSPAGLDQLYSRYWEQIQQYEGYDRDRAIAMLRWATFAHHPLTVRDLVGAVIVCDDDGEDLALEDLPDELDEEYLQTEVLELCGALLEAQESSDDSTEIGMRSIHLTHFSAKEFLVRQFSRPDGEQEVDQHLLLARLCLRYILTPEVWETLSTSPMTDPFRDYATATWHAHIRSAWPGAEEKVMDLTRVLFDTQSLPWKGWYSHVRMVALSHETICTDHEDDNAKRLGSPLYFASYFGFPEHVKYLLADGRSDINYRGSTGGTALHGACTGGRTSVVELLLDNGADIAARNCCGESPLHLAVRGQYADLLHLLLERGIEINAVDSANETALYVTASEGFLVGFNELFNRGADVTIPRRLPLEEPETPFFAAVSQGHVSIVKTLLQHDGNLHDSVRDEWTPLATALVNGHVDVARFLINDRPGIATQGGREFTHAYYGVLSNSVEIVDLLLQHGADPTLALPYRPLEIAVENGNMDIARRILDWKPVNEGAAGSHWPMEWLNSTGGKFPCTMLHFAVYKEQWDIAKLLLQHGADPTLAQDEMSPRPLHNAARVGNLDMVKTLLYYWPPDRPISPRGSVESNSNEAKGTEADSGEKQPRDGTWLNARMHNNLTAIHQASVQGSAEIVKLLIESGADLSVPTSSHGYPALILACIYNKIDVVKLLCDSGADITAVSKEGFSSVLCAARNNAPDILRYLIDRGADITGRENQGLSALMLGAMYNHVGVIEVLLDSGDDINQAAKHGFTSVYLAAEYDATDAVRLLVKRGADISLHDEKEGYTPIMIACIYGNLDTVKVLLDSGASIKDGSKKFLYSPLHLAARNGHMELMRLLLDRGADVDGHSGANVTPYQAALLWEHLELAEVLLQCGADSEKLCAGEPLVLQAVRYGKIETLRFLMRHGTDLNKQSGGEVTALQIACYEGNTEAATLLLDLGADPDCAACPTFLAPCLGACRRWNTHLLRMLLKRGADGRRATASGATLLHVASFFGHADGVDIACGLFRTEPVLVDWVGRPSIFYAVGWGQERCAELLLRMRPWEESLQDKYGSNLMDVAIRHGHVSTVEKLILRGGHNIKKSSVGRSTLYWARRSGSIKMIRLMEAFLPGSADDEEDEGWEDWEGPFGSSHATVSETSQICTVCTLYNLRRGYRACRICDTTFRVCLGCYDRGYRCLDESHELEVVPRAEDQE